MCQFISKEIYNMAKAMKKTSNTPAAMSNVYETKDVLVSSLTSSVLQSLTESDIKVDDGLSRKIYNNVNQVVTTQIDSLVNRLMKVLD
jgi:hypothetical protein